MKAKMVIALLFIFCSGVVFGWWSTDAKVFPDPYHQEGNVSFFTWCYREIYEVINGEVIVNTS